MARRHLIPHESAVSLPVLTDQEYCEAGRPVGLERGRLTPVRVAISRQRQVHAVRVRHRRPGSSQTSATLRRRDLRH
jgi:hypothetical protein